MKVVGWLYNQIKAQFSHRIWVKIYSDESFLFERIDWWWGSRRYPIVDQRVRVDSSYHAGDDHDIVKGMRPGGNPEATDEEDDVEEQAKKETEHE